MLSAAIGAGRHDAVLMTSPCAIGGLHACLMSFLLSCTHHGVTVEVVLTPAATADAAAADRTTRARQARDTASISLAGSKSSSDQQTYEHLRVMYEEARERSQAAVADAENAYAAIRLLIPSAAGQARRYFDLCIKADAHPDETKVDRERARQAVEETIQRALGGDLPVNWMLAEPKD
jgi:hypothetical protein